MTAEKRNNKVAVTPTTVKIPTDLYEEIKDKMRVEGTNLQELAVGLLEEWLMGKRKTPIMEVPPQLRRIVPMLADFIRTKEEEQQFLVVAEYMRSQRR